MSSVQNLQNPEKLNIPNKKGTHSSFSGTGINRKTGNDFESFGMKQDRPKDRFGNAGISKGFFFQEQESMDELTIQAIKGEGSDIHQGQIKNRKQNGKSGKVPQEDKLQPISSILKTNAITVLNQQEKIGMKVASIEEINIERRNRSKMEKQKKKSRQKPQAINKEPVRSSEFLAERAQDFFRMNIPKHKRLSVMLKRNRSGLSWLYPQYDMFFEEDMEFMLSSHKNALKWGSNYHIAGSNERVSETHPEYLGTVSSNLSGSFWNYFETRNGRNELIATITYNHQASACSSSPRQIEVYLISPFYQYSDLEGTEESMTKNLYEIAQEGSNLQSKRIYKLINKKPKWNHSSERFQIDFHGKARHSSVKNMIMVNASKEDEEALLLTKYAENTYHADIEFPLSPRLAMAIITSSFDFKWASE